MRGFVFCLTVLLVLPGGAIAQRLPIVAMPEHYILRFEPDLAAETFAGHARILIRVLQPTTDVVLHAAELKFHAVSVRAGGVTQRAEISNDTGRETATLRVARAIAPGVAELEIAYSGVLNRQLRGFYISEANDRKYAVTQLEATDARRMFPSFDEPQLKATFDITAVVDEHDYAISNGPIVAELPGPAAGKRTLKFARTARMSTYLVALAVGDFECVADEVRSRPIRVCATPGKRALTEFALATTRELLEYFNDYFAIDYPFAKLDQVAIPDFAAGAMENTGAVFYRESILLVDPSRASFAARKRAALVIAHEIAHHWFGNLVTMKWWDDLWLNEGFATWMEAKAVAGWKPEWDVGLDETQSIQSAMAIDALESTRSVRTRAETPVEINELFDPIAYEKAAAVLRMVESYVGEQAFRGGVNAYLETHAYGNAAAEDFWTMLTRATGAPVDRIMASFVDQPGVPLVSVSTVCRDGTTAVTLAQERYRQDARASAAVSQTWAIPVCVNVPGARDASVPASCTLLDEAVVSFEIEGCVPWLVANRGARGYYRTSYSEPMLRALVSTEALTPAAAIMLLADEWALVRAGRHGIGRFLEVAGALARRRADVAAVAESAGTRLDYVHEYLAGPSSVKPFEQWVRRTLGPALERLGPAESGETMGEARSRAALMTALGAAGAAPDVLRTARASIQQYLRNPSEAIDPALLTALVDLAALNGDAKLFDAYLRRSRSAATPEERYRFLYALAEFRNRDLVGRTMQLALSDAIRTQDRGALVAAVLGNPAGREIAWEIVRARWSEIERTLRGFGGTSRIVQGLGAFCDRRTLEEIERFFGTHRVPSAERTLRQSVERIERCIALAEMQQPQLEQWLSSLPLAEHR